MLIFKKGKERPFALCKMFIPAYNEDWHAGFFDVREVLRHYQSGPELGLRLCSA